MPSVLALALAMAAAAAAGKHEETSTCNFDIKAIPGDTMGASCSIPGMKKGCCAFITCYYEEGGHKDAQKNAETCRKKLGAGIPEECPVLDKTLEDQDEMAKVCKVDGKHEETSTCNFDIKAIPGDTMGQSCSIPGVKQNCCAFMKCYTEEGGQESGTKAATETCSKKLGAPPTDCPVLNMFLKDQDNMAKVCKPTSRLFVETQSTQVPQRHAYMQHSVLMVGSAGLVGFVALAVVLRRITAGPVTASAMEINVDNEEQMGLE